MIQNSKKATMDMTNRIYISYTDMVQQWADTVLLHKTRLKNDVMQNVGQKSEGKKNNTACKKILSERKQTSYTTISHSS